MSKLRFLLQIHKKDLFLLPAPAEVAVDITNSQGFYSSAIHFSQIFLVF